MGNVTLGIGGREFMLACADGEEAHILRLARLIDSKATASGAVGQTETRMLLFAALMMADELHELRSRPEPQAVLPIEVPAIPAQFAERLARIASRVENLADLLETEAANA
ncbi:MULTISPECIES: cell division protein ZapA [Novosphingobium]|jgi:cell division protein ZapA|uniref:cell division protein ZapA n=1 Tax=Novosphingobium TaxID=165696 RepID=UPI0022F26617|nr:MULTISPECIES: cell division protein ZapA [Novosphingobium]GLK42441.1 cell division protein ZapA [Novosphingobium resinovorum]